MSWSADFQKGLTAAQSGDFATALREWKPLAKQGNASAQFNLGIMYDIGRGVPQDDKTAVKWYKLSAKQGFFPAQTSLGVMYSNGRGVPKDYKTALNWYRLAAKQGYAGAQYYLGVMYANGQGVPQDYPAAVKWWTLSAKKGNGGAQKKLGDMYEKGKGVLQDYPAAVKWWTLASQSRFLLKNWEQTKIHARGKNGGQMHNSLLSSINLLSAQYKLGVMYDKGRGVIKNDKTAVKWYELSAKQGFFPAQTRLGVMYSNGRGVPKDYKTAVKWYRLAIKHGGLIDDSKYQRNLSDFHDLPNPYNNLGEMYEKGQGVIQDYVSAHMLFNIAASSGFSTAVTNRDIVAKKMSPSQIEKAQDLARECVRKKYKGC
jgi:TPR repeat protein